MTPNRIFGTQVLRRISEILRFVAIKNRHGARLVDITRALKLEPPTAHRLLQGLTTERMLVRDDATRRYRLGPHLYELGLTAEQQYSLLDAFQPSIARIIDVTGDSVVLTVRSGIDGVCVERVNGAFPIQAHTVKVGTRRPLAAGTGGLAILSGLTDEECKRVLTANAADMPGVAKHNEAKLSEQVRKTRRMGYALGEIRETNPGITSIGVPVFGKYGVPVAGLSVIALANRLLGERRSEIVKLLKTEAENVSRTLTREAAETRKNRQE